MKQECTFQPPILSDEEALALGRSVALNRWRAQLLHQAALAVEAVLHSPDELPEKTRQKLRDVLLTILGWQLEFAATEGSR